MRVPALFVLIFFCWIGIGDAQHRAELHLFQYANVNTNVQRVAYEDFRGLLVHNLPRLSEELEITHPAVERLRLNALDEESGQPSRVGSLASRRTYWSETGALGVLTGYILLRDGTPHIHTNFFWGDLHSSDASEMIELELPVTGDAFSTTHDSHSVATLYALAHEISADCDHVSEAIYLLNMALLRATSVGRDFQELGAMLTSTIEAAIAELREPCNE